MASVRRTGFVYFQQWLVALPKPGRKFLAGGWRPPHPDPGQQWLESLPTYHDLGDYVGLGVVTKEISDTKNLIVSIDNSGVLHMVIPSNQYAKRWRFNELQNEFVQIDNTVNAAAMVALLNIDGLTSGSAVQKDELTSDMVTFKFV